MTSDEQGDPSGDADLDIVSNSNEASPEAGSAEGRHRPAAVPVVGVGASTGGLEAFLALLEGLPAETGLAFVFVLHVSAKHVSALPGLLATRTAMPVRQAVDGSPIEPNTIYTNPPDRWVTLDGDVLRTAPRPENESPLMSVNVLFRSLAESRGQRSIAVVLSGSAGDGADGMRAVADAGGMTLVQRPDTAEHPHMPEEAIATGMAHLVLPPRKLAEELTRLARHPYLAAGGAGVPAAAPPVPEQVLARIFGLLRAAHGVDFGQYKSPTIQRRMQRRMALHHVERVEDYLEVLQKQPEEVDRLFDDILIHVTRFFRDPETYVSLAERVFPDILAGRTGSEPIRVWIPGCSTGEETYSVAIALLEFLGDRAGSVPIQIFSTDVSERAVERARTGLYPEGIVQDLSRERLTRFFVRNDAGYRVRQSVRELCVFARQDLIRDPPFSRLDLIVCRNVLIYLAPAAQKRLMGSFHYALKPHGFLLLGSAETVGHHSDLFAVVDKKHKLYAAKPRSLRPAMEFPVPGWPDIAPAFSRQRPFERSPTSSLHNEATQFLLSRYAPPGVVVDDDMAIIQFRGQTGAFLEPAPGEASLNLLKMARPGLLNALRAAVREARERNATAHRRGLEVHVAGQSRQVNLEVTPLATGEKRHYLIIFEDTTVRPTDLAPGPSPVAAAGDGDQAGPLHRELAASREYLQSIIQDLEAANEELQSANEEILSSNEELQSTNEELDTAKEELQSTNEELNTVNDELHDRNDELSRVNSDLTNLLASVEIAIVMVSDDLRIRRFTPMAGKLLNLIPGDVGRSIVQIKPNVECPDLEERIRGVIDEVRPTEVEVRDGVGRWFSLRIRPYKDLDRRINGAVLSLFDIDELRRKEAALASARDLGEAVVDAIRQPLVVLEPSLRVRRVNRAFREAFGVGPGDAEGGQLYDIPGDGWRDPGLRSVIEPLVGDGNVSDGLAVYDFPKLGRRTIRVSVPRRGDSDRHEPLIILWIDGDGPTELA